MSHRDPWYVNYTVMFFFLFLSFSFFFTKTTTDCDFIEFVTFVQSIRHGINGEKYCNLKEIEIILLRICRRLECTKELMTIVIKEKFNG